ncbi:hypothetical protein H2200_005005 [Cladophialophora chaetospira]|uniref:Uncharacterized protein n=1 Tax=Cladophialophora chaetospira TaxID=386627 RepID=A0AA39CJH1_9EURO|nr:hypothetical protein H2200_005005 [Cladophialophora chaetospira]
MAPGNKEGALGEDAGRFLFINKTSSTLAKNPGESFTISSHVSKTHRKWLKEEKLRKLLASSGKAVAQRAIQPAKLQFQATGSTTTAPPIRYEPARDPIASIEFQGSSKTAATDAYDAPDTNQNPGNSNYHPIADPGLAVYPFEESQDSDYQEQRIQIIAKGRHAWTRGQHSLAPSRGSSDPFSAAALPLSARDHDIIRQAQRFFVFVVSPDKKSAVWRAPIGDSSSSHIRLRNTIADEAEIHAILAAGYAVNANVSSHDYTRSLARGLYHKTKAVELLRDRLVKHGFSLSVSTLIRLLISLDFECSDNEAALVHLRGLWAMAATTPGILMDAQDLLRVSDAWISISLLKKPEISPSRYDPGERRIQPFSKALRDLESGNTIIATRKLGDATHKHSTFDSHTWTLLEAAQEIVNTKAVMDRIEDPDLLHDVIHWMNKRSAAVTGYLTTGYVDNKEAAAAPGIKGTESASKTLMAAACLCAMMFMNFKFLDLPTNYNFSKTCQKIAEVLRGASKRVEHGRRQALDSDYLWLLTLTTMGNDIFSARGDIPYSPWPVMEFHRVCDRLKLTGQDDIIAVLHWYPHYAEMDVFLVEVLWLTNPATNIIPWSRWRSLLNHA